MTFLRLCASGLALLVAAARAADYAPCNFTALPTKCTDQNGAANCVNNYAYAPLEFLHDCLNRIPLDPFLKKDALDITYGLADQLYAFTDILLNPGANTNLANRFDGTVGYFYNKTVDIRSDIKRLADKNHSNQFEFEYDLAYTFGQLRDAHTLYRAPFPGLGFWRPFSFASALDSNGQQIAMIASVADVAAAASAEQYVNTTASVNDIKFSVGKPIKTINGIDGFEYVYSLAKEQCIVRSDAVCLSYFLGTNYYNAITRRIPANGTEVIEFTDGTTITTKLVGVVNPGAVWTNVTNVTDAIAAIRSPDDYSNYTSALERLANIPGFAIPEEIQQHLDALKSVSRIPKVTAAYVQDDPFDVDPLRMEEQHHINSFSADDSTRVPNLVPLQNVNNALLYFRGAQAKLPFNILKMTTFSVTINQELLDALKFIAEDGRRGNVENLLVDFTGNGGGLVAAQALLAQALVPSFQDSFRLCEPYDYRISPYFEAQSKALNASLDAVPVNASSTTLANFILPTVESLRANVEVFTNLTLALLSIGTSDSSLVRFNSTAANLSATIHSLPLEANGTSLEVLSALRDELAYAMAVFGANATADNGLIYKEKNVETLTTFTPAFDYILNPVTKQFGGINGSYTKPVTIACPPLSEPFVMPYYYPNIYVLTDGSCGSACSNVITKLWSDSNVTVVSVGGALRDPADIGSFNGGNVLEYQNIWYQVARARLASLAGGARNISIPYIARPFATRAVSRFNWRMGYFRGLGQANLPREFYLLPAQVRIPVWGFGYGKWPTVDPVQLYGLYSTTATVLGIGATPAESNQPIPSPSVLPLPDESPSAPSPTESNFAYIIGFSVAGAAIVLGASFLAIVLYRRRRQHGYIQVD